MGGIAGTAVMFAEAASLALEIDLAAVPRPEEVAEEAWLTCFPSFGFLLAVSPLRSSALRERLALAPELLAVPIGRFAAAPVVERASVMLRRGSARETLWAGHESLTGF
jgi:selenophosphate synthetase-related protein